MRLSAANGEAWRITDIASLSVSDVRQWVEKLHLTGRDADIARDLVPEIQSRLEFLEEVGLGYLTLDRGAPTLSGGEAQRIRLAAQLGSNLQGVCYVLDEPTIGLDVVSQQTVRDLIAPPGSYPYLRLEGGRIPLICPGVPKRAIHNTDDTACCGVRPCFK